MCQQRSQLSWLRSLLSLPPPRHARDAAAAAVEDAEERWYAESKLDANRGVARVDSQACEDPHVAVR